MRNILIGISLLCATAANAADLKWALQTQDGATVMMSQVGYILYTDGSSTMSIVKTDNSVIEDVTKVSFAKVDGTGIAQTVADKGIAVLSRVVDNSLTVTGCPEGQSVSVISASGAVEVKTLSSGDHTTIDVSRLVSGVYMLRVGKNTVKFIKK
ncbi:MAG: T9SS type A sorting domain-containing protein [Prevotellaceae bacterium]|nr:T9SS type A sorting domain-containing protein [Prevotellaceae bacterium]